VPINLDSEMLHKILYAVDMNVDKTQ
jgi:hypothetical protein